MKNMEYRFLPDGQKISTIGIGVGNYGYENVSSDESNGGQGATSGIKKQVV